MPAYDHVVVGSGVAGMTAALLLAKAGHSVALVESFPLLAPTIRGFRRRGVQFDTGLHYVGGLGDGHPLDVYFKHLGLSRSIRKEAYDPKAFDRFIDEKSHTAYAMPCGFDTYAQRLNELFPDEVKAVKSYVTAIRKIMEASPYLNFSMDFTLDNAMHADLTSVKDYLNSITEDETLKAVLSYPCILYGVPPEEALFATHALVAGSYILSTHTIEGGGLALTKAYEAQMKGNGVDVMCKTRVSAIHVDDARSVTGVSLDNDTYLTTKSCMWTAHPRGLLDVAPDNAFRPAFRKRLASLEDTASALMLYGISNAPVEELGANNIISWPGTSFKDNLDGVLPPEESVIYLSAAHDPNTDKTAVTAIMPQRIDDYAKWKDSPLNSRPDEYKEFKRTMLQAFEDEVFNRVPSLKGKVNFVEGSTPLSIRDYCTTPTGSLYGLKHSVEQFNPPPVTRTEGLTLAGQSIVAPGILGAVISAYLTCGILLGHEELHNELRHYA